MARRICPSCGSAYNGRKCRNCCYENFTEEIAHRNHTHKGEPLVIHEPTRRPVKRKDPFGCEKKTRKPRPMAGFFALLAIINFMMPMLRDWGLDLKARERAAGVHTVAVRPEQVISPEETVVLHQERGVTVFASAKDLEDFRDGLCIYVQYSGSLSHVTLSAGEIQVNGCDMKSSSLVCKAQRGGNIGKGWLELDERDLEENGIQKPETLCFTMTALGSNGRALFTTGQIVIETEVAA